MRKKACVLLGFALLLGAAQVLLAKPGVVLRFDDAHSISQWQAVADAFMEQGLRMSIALPPGDVLSPHAEPSRNFLRQVAAKGFEIMDHTHNHHLFCFRCRTPQEFDAWKNLPIVAEAHARTQWLVFKAAFDEKHPNNRTFTGFVTNNVLVTDESLAKTFHRPMKIFIPSLNRFFGFFDNPTGHFVLKHVWTIENVQVPDVPPSEMILCMPEAFSLSDDVLRFQAARVREAFTEIGVPPPRTWIQPGGWEPHLSAEQFARVYATEFGYTGADCIPNHAQRGLPNNPKFARYQVRPESFFDSPRVSQESIRAKIRGALGAGKNICFISHMWVSPKMKGGWAEWMAELRALLAWLKSENIPVKTYSEVCAEVSTAK